MRCYENTESWGRCEEITGRCKRTAWWCRCRNNNNGNLWKCPGFSMPVQRAFLLSGGVWGPWLTHGQKPPPLRGRKVKRPGKPTKWRTGRQAREPLRTMSFWDSAWLTVASTTPACAQGGLPATLCLLGLSHETPSQLLPDGHSLLRLPCHCHAASTQWGGANCAARPLRAATRRADDRIRR